jgi:serine/threonine protein kinase
MGVVLFRLLTSELPFKAESGVAMVHRQLNDPPTPVREVRSELPDACDEILTRALSKAAEARFQSAEEFRSALTRLDPAIPQTGVSRISAVAPAVDPPAVTLAESDVTLRPTPTPAILSGTPAPEPSVTVVLPHGGNPSLQSPATRRGLEPRVVATIAVAAVLVAGIPVTGLLWWRAHRSPSVTTPAVTAPLTSSSPPQASAPTMNAPVKAGTTPGVSPARPASSTAATNAPPAPDATAPLARPVLPPLTFGKIRLLMIEDKKSRDVDASLRLGPDTLEIVDGTRTIERAPYQDVISLYYSHSKDPWWMPADGQATPVTKTGSIFGFLRGTPDWITVRTRRNFIPLRVNENDVALLTRELEARTGARVVKIK